MKKISLLKYHHAGRDNLNEKRHFHDSEFEILHVLSGNGTMMIKDKLYSISPNTIFFVNGSVAHCSSPENPTLYMRNKINFSKEVLTSTAIQFGCQNIINELFSKGGCAITLSLDSSLKIDEIFLKMSENISKDSKIALLKIFTDVFSVMDIVQSDSRKSVPFVKNKISDVIEYINNNINQKMTLDIIARNTKISKYYLCHSFYDTVGMTVFKYIEFVRIAQAKQLLAESNLTISEISQAVGYDSFAYFSKVFKKNENMTPGEYKKSNKN